MRIAVGKHTPSIYIDGIQVREAIKHLKENTKLPNSISVDHNEEVIWIDVETNIRRIRI